MLLKILTILTFCSTIIFIQPVLADDAEDKAKFNRLYAEFNELYAHSAEIDPIIEVAEKLYKLAPKIYGKNHQNTAVVTYNLASLYDERGGETETKDEEKALELYEDYFFILEKLNTPKDLNYVIQFKRYVITDFNIHNVKTEDKLSNEILNIAQNIELTDIEYANLQYFVAIKRASNGIVTGTEELLYNVYAQYLKEFGETDKQTGSVLYWLAQNSSRNNNYEEAITYYNNFIDTYSSIDDPDKITLLKNARLRLYEIYFLLRNDELKSKQFLEISRLNSIERGEDFTKKYPNEYVPIKRTPPRYPSRAADQFIEGYAILAFTITSEGTTKNIKTYSTNHKMFSDAAIKAAKKYEYQPRIIDGHAVEVNNVMIDLTFRLEG